MKDSYAVVTGASSGIGKAIAIELANKKINLILIALPNTGLAEVAQQISSDYQVVAKYCEIDLTQEGAAKYVYEWCKQQQVKINTLVNNAGLGTQGSFENNTVTDLQVMLKLNNQALVMLAYYFLPELKLNSPSHILDVGSLASFMNIPGKAVYSASKSFIYSFSLSLRMELKPYHINVSCLCPGGTLTSERVMKNFNQVKYAGKSWLQKPACVASEAVSQLYQGKKLIIPGWHNKFLFQLQTLLPDYVVDLILTSLFFKSKENESRYPLSAGTLATPNVPLT